MIEIIPAIDLIGGKCVRLTQGNYDSVKFYDKNPLNVAKRYEDIGIKRLHIVDLDGAKLASPQNLRIVEDICSKTNLKVQFGGGIKSDEAIDAVLSAGVAYAIIGTLAVVNPQLFCEWLTKYGKSIILGADIIGVNVATNGWLDTSEMSIYSLIERNKNLKQVICTDISKDGMLQGPNFELYSELQSRYSDIDITVSGGISSFSDIIKLNDMNLRSVIVGKAIYEGLITDKEIIEWLQKE